MESTNKPEPLIKMPELGTVCPVCGKKSYSAAGVHPQCSMQLADAPRQAAIAARKKKEQAEVKAAKSNDIGKVAAKRSQFVDPKRVPK